MSQLQAGVRDYLRLVPGLIPGQPLDNHGVWGEDAVPPGTPHPFIMIFEGTDVYRFRNHQNDGPAETEIIVTVEDEQEGAVASYSKSEHIADLVESSLNRHKFPVADRTVTKCVREVRRRRPAERREAVVSVAVILQFQVTWNR